ncbi:MAG: nucleoside hydrolase [Oscillospiraceae bacterium]|nr:nucleoside hydrolase [Oscillospiraceae bacterium]
MEKRKIIIDTDCGSDDAMAIAMALNDERYEILFFSVCAGNVSAEQAVINTLTTLEKAGSYEPPVYLGSVKPLVRELAYAHETHGMDGMGDIGLVPARLKVTPGNGILKTIEALENSERGEIEIIALGPLTNLALAIRTAPDAMAKVRRISVMGSAGLGVGNVSPVAEFNIWQDPEAAKIVFESGLPLLVVGWDACLDDAMLNKREIERLRNSGELGRFAVDCNRCLLEMNQWRFGDPCLDMADPAALAAALCPECIETCADYYCEVDTSDGISCGAVHVDVYGFSGKQPNASVCSKLKSEIYKEYIFKTLGA